MGGAFTAIADDASAAYWNPAGLSQISSYEISVSSAPVYFQQHVNPNANGNRLYQMVLAFAWV
jgi:long-subunit fatty acid transport protein